jgi:hypothetical protein
MLEEYNEQAKELIEYAVNNFNYRSYSVVKFNVENDYTNYDSVTNIYIILNRVSDNYSDVIKLKYELMTSYEAYSFDMNNYNVFEAYSRNLNNIRAEIHTAIDSRISTIPQYSDIKLRNFNLRNML